LARCRLHDATLVIAKLDRLSRDAHFLLGLQKAGVRFVAADMPEANEMVVGIMAVVAQAERKMISERTKAALARKRAWYERLSYEEILKLTKEGKRVALGTPENLRNEEEGRAKGRATRTAAARARAADVLPIVEELQASGAKTLRQIAAGLNKRGIPTPRGGRWRAVQVKRVLDRGSLPEGR
jgi:DNA invertase Pin-like site-specific DNA recombinase